MAFFIKTGLWKILALRVVKRHKNLSLKFPGKWKNPEFREIE
jgi:hypothetical protein